MKKLVKPSAGAITLCACLLTQAVGAVEPATNGIAFPEGYKNWKTIAVSHRTDNSSLRSILGNEIAVEAARSGHTNPWPDGAILAKLVWKDRTDEHWSSATVPGEFVHAEFMVKDSSQYQTTGGWGFARWLGQDQEPYGKDADFVQQCFGCHIPVKSRDYVYTTPVTLP
jgi:hypothetical protein